MKQWQKFCATGLVLCMVLSTSASQTSQNITIGGTGDSQDLLLKLAAAYQLKHPDCKIDIPDSIGSSGGIKALASNKVDLARVARPLKPREIKHGFTYRPFAQSPVVCVINQSVKGIESIASKQILDIYQGTLTHWEQLKASPGKIYAIAREKGDSSFGILGKQVPGFEDIAKLKAKICFTTPDTAATLAKNPGTIGFLPLSMVNRKHLRILKINGIFPTAENIAQGKYKYLIPFAIVYRSDELTGLRKEFINFLFNAEAQKLMENNGTFPWTQP